MIEIILFAIGFLMLGLASAVVGQAAERRTYTVACRCGITVARDIVIVDPSDIEDIRDTLTENCLACQSRAIVHSESKEPARDRD